MFTFHPTDPNRIDVVSLPAAEFEDRVSGRGYRVYHGWSEDGGQTWSWEPWGAEPGYLVPPAFMGWDHAGSLWIAGVGTDGRLYKCSGQNNQGVWTQWATTTVEGEDVEAGPAGPQGPPGATYDDTAVKAELARHDADLQAIKTAAGGIQ